MSLEQRKEIIGLIEQARTDGARLSTACQSAEIDPATYRRWQCNGDQIIADHRASATRPEPANKLTQAERAAILETCHTEDFQSLPPSQIVPTLADQGEYLGSESSFYRVLREANEQQHRGRAQNRQTRAKPPAFCTTGPNQCWTWDVTWCTPGIRGEQDARIGSRVCRECRQLNQEEHKR